MEETSEKGDGEELSLIRALLEQNETIFELLKGLPPKRTTNHHILTLKDN